MLLELMLGCNVVFLIVIVSLFKAYRNEKNNAKQYQDICDSFFESINELENELAEAQMYIDELESRDEAIEILNEKVEESEINYSEDEELFVKLLTTLDDLIDTAYNYLINGSDLPYRAFNLGNKFDLYDLLDNENLPIKGMNYVYPYYSDENGWDEDLGYELGFDVYNGDDSIDNLFRDIIDNDCNNASICKSILETLINNFTFKEPTSKYFYGTVLDYDRIVQLLNDRRLELKHINYEARVEAV